MENERNTNEDARFAHYEASAEQMRRLNLLFHRSAWWNIGNALIIITISIISVGIISAGRADNLDLPAHDTASQLAAATAFQLLAVVFFAAVCVLSILAATKKRSCAIALTLLYLLLLLYQLILGLPVSNVLYTVCFLAGLILNVRVIHAFRKLDQLSRLPGYPQFLQRLDESTDYELPLYLQNRKQFEDMEDLSPSPSAPQAEMSAIPAEAEMEPLAPPDAPLQPDTRPAPRTQTAPHPASPDLSGSAAPDSLKLRTSEELFGKPIFTSEQIYTAPETHQEEH